MRTALFWCSTHSIQVITWRKNGRRNPHNLQGKSSCSLKIGPIGCPERSVSNYHCPLCNISAERSCYALRNGNMKLRPVNVTVTFPYSGTNRLLSSSLTLSLTFLMSRPQIFTFRCTFTVQTWRIAALSYLPPPLTFYIKLHSSSAVSLLRTHWMA